MTLDEFRALIQPKVAEIIERYLNQPPGNVALTLSNTSFPAAIIATQIKYLQKSKQKIPTYYNSRCIIPPRAYEQSSSEAAASIKNYFGQFALDLTLGLGVDTLSLARSFRNVVSVESSEPLIAIGQHNLNRIGIKNVSVIHNKAEKFIEDYHGIPFDLVYVDPDRRDAKGNRFNALEQSSPNLLPMMPKLREITATLVIKLSPLFDPHPLPQIFPALEKAITISIQGECKEVLAQISFQSSHRVPTKEVWLNRNQHVKKYAFPWQSEAHTNLPNAFTPAYIYEPDVAFYQSHTSSDLFQLYFPSLKGSMNHPTGYFFALTLEESFFPGRIFQIIAEFPFSPKKIKQYKKQHAIDQLHVIKRYFPLSVKDIRKQLGFKEGGEYYLICSIYANEEKKAWLTKRVK